MLSRMLFILPAFMGAGDRPSRGLLWQTINGEFQLFYLAWRKPPYRAVGPPLDVGGAAAARVGP